MLHARKDYNFRIQDSDHRIGKDEPVFLLRAQDKHMLPMLKHYLSLLEDKESNKAMDIAVLKHMARVIEWQTHNNTKEPDVPLKEVL